MISTNGMKGTPLTLSAEASGATLFAKAACIDESAEVDAGSEGVDVVAPAD